MEQQTSHDAVLNTEETPQAELGTVVLSPEVSDALNKINPEQRKVLVHFIRETKMSAFKGPIPPPEVLQGYENVQQGFGDRILRMAERQQDHRIKCEDKVVQESTTQSKRGQWFGFIIAILFLSGALALGFTGHEVLGGIIGGGTLISVVSVFLTNKPPKQSREKTEIELKDED